MKKSVSLLAALGLTVSLAGAFSVQAESPEQSLEDVVLEEQAKTEASSIDESTLREHSDIDRGIFDVGSQDIVTISSDGLFDIDSPALGIQLYPAYGWLVFTQDLGLQFDQYYLTFSDPVGIAKELVNEGKHLFMVDYDFQNAIYIQYSDDALGKVIGNAANLSQDDEATVLKLVSSMYFGGQNVKPVTIGDYRYYSFADTDNGFYVYETYVNGICVDIYLENFYGQAPEDYILEDLESMLSDISFY